MSNLPGTLGKVGGGFLTCKWEVISFEDFKKGKIYSRYYRDSNWSHSGCFRHTGLYCPCWFRRRWSRRDCLDVILHSEASHWTHDLPFKYPVICFRLARGE